MAERRRGRGRFLEIVAVLLLGVATVGTAWCALQSSLWSGESERVSAQADAQRVEANRLFALATQALSYDATVVADYARAVADKNVPLQEFYRQVLVRPAFGPFLDAWEEEAKAGRIPPNILEDETYVSSLMDPYNDQLAEAEASAARAATAGRTGNLYVLATVLLAVSLFFAGVMASFTSDTARLMLLLGGFLTLALAARHVIDLPVATATLELFG